MKLTDAQLKNLMWLDRSGGSGYLDRYGRVVAAGITCAQGSWISWLNLIANGLVSGGNGRLEVTEYGRRHLTPFPKEAA